MKEHFDDCVVELIRFEAVDVITISDPDECLTKTGCENKGQEF